ncbi:MAG: hypothetical protein WCH04_18610, partial [Gammaproteobacteria bacterium]
MVYFGTGSIFSNDDALNDGEDPSNPGSFTKKQAVYGIWVDTSSLAGLKANADGNGFPYTSSDLQTQTLAVTSKQFIADGPTQSVRISPTEQAVNYHCPSPSDTCTLHKGWMVPLPNCGERMLGTPFVRAGRIQFVTSNPTGLNCGERTLEGDSWVMSLDYLTGGDGATLRDLENTIVYNLNGDLDLSDPGDTVLNTVSSDPPNKAPVGLSLGEGNIAQPTFARLRLGTDKMFINGLILAFPPISNPGEILGGHIDVETDSPTNGVIATNNRDKHSEGYNIQINDGLGGAVDGHVHDYDGIHSVDYVDLFELEPRRGQANLNASIVTPPVSGNCSTTDNEKGILVGSSCIQAIEGELNRAYDTLHTDADGNSDPTTGGVSTYQSEVNSLNNADPTDITPPGYTTAVPETKFIVVLANADLSTGGMLQIGCRKWTVVEYQNMITTQLKGGTPPDQLDDTVNGGTNNMVFTLSSIKNAGSGGECPDTDISDDDVNDHGLSKTPTLRIGFGGRAIYDQGIIPTRAQCVLGLHKPEDKVCFTDEQILSNFDESNPATDEFYQASSSSCAAFTGMSTPPAQYIRNPAWNLHITKDGNNTYRWRNGALTVQLLHVNPDGSAGYALQSNYLTSGSGIIARAFTPVTVDNGLNGSNKVTITHFNNDSVGTASGMLYEANIFFHYSALNDGIRNSDPANNSTPPEGGCYGGSGYNGHTVIDVGGLNPAEYKSLVNPLNAQCDADPDHCPLQRYTEVLQRIENAESDDDLNAALLDLANLLAEPGSESLAEYVKYREYVSPKYNYGKDLLDIDRKQLEGSDSGTSTNEDGTPLDVTIIETIDLEAKGPNYHYGRRNWVDIRQ